MSEVKVYVWDARLRDEDYRPATADEKKAAHPKCGTCEHCALSPSGFDYCANPEVKHMPYVKPELDYCRHHTPREGAEGGQG